MTDMALKLLEDYVAECLPESGQDGSPFTVTLTYAQWRQIIAALRRADLAQTEIKDWKIAFDGLIAAAEVKTATINGLQARIAALEKDWETDADYIRMAERIKELEKVASKFVERHDEIEPALRDVFTFYAIHGMKWPEDKNWKRELDALRDTLKSRA